jgi:hypothetical protein
MVLGSVGLSLQEINLELITLVPDVMDVMLAID